MPERSDAKEKKFLTRPLWLANIGKWDAQGIGDSTFAGLTEREVFEIYAPIAERIISDFDERNFFQGKWRRSPDFPGRFEDSYIAERPWVHRWQPVSRRLEERFGF